MNPAPQEKTQEILETLSVHINSGHKIDQFTYVRLMHEIKKLPNPIAEVTCEGLLYGANHEYDKANKHLKEALENYHHSFLATNYLAYLARTGQNFLHATESLRLAECYSTNRDLQILAISSAYLIGDEARLSDLIERARSLSSDEQRPEMEGVSMWIDNIRAFRVSSGLSENELSALSKIMCDVATRHKQPIVYTCYYSDIHGIDSAYVSEILHDDPDTISDMNIDLAIEIADSGLFDGKKATAWFRGLDKELKKSIYQ
ncbi:hypothetical protein [Providencia alcalifaciens]|uniref:hypothetical protein n=1 Tax=Providencia alcalifaciens TaxID=126385 RepID=UPI000DA0CF05|nr:hypothetical protein [Providencia alcalifaciens]MTC29145.1 hypothetical protein [Providencia alcalifaciens]MTC65001.1 hypothetical protein [Providencia alcalifaciens]SPY68061.1 Uncharacterised protein [Providencia alcalifaciens]